MTAYQFGQAATVAAATLDGAPVGGGVHARVEDGAEIRTEAPVARITTKGDHRIAMSHLVLGLAAQVNIFHSDAADKLTIAVFAGDDTIDAAGMDAGLLSLLLDGSDGDDNLVGSDGKHVVYEVGSGHYRFSVAAGS